VAVSHYEVLGVSPSASSDQVRAAYRAAARDHHPDAGGEQSRMQAVNAAWRVLGDPARRAAYDRALSRGAGAARPAGAAGSTGTGAAGNGSGTAPPDDLTAEEWADLADGRPIGQSMALSGWWAILPPGMVVASVVALFGAFYFTSPVLLAASGGCIIMAMGLFVLAPLRAMAKRKE
jgi:hypothetical protein